MKVIETFRSIDGEGIRTGKPVFFIRLAGCNLRCTYCDTKYSYENPVFEEMSAEDLVELAKNSELKLITLTGGEPLIHKDVDKLVQKLLNEGFEVNIETNGSVDVNEFDNKLKPAKGKVIYTIDFKSISSGVTDKMLHSNLEFANRNNHIIKFVVGSKQDLEQAKQIIEEYELKCEVYISPIFGNIKPKDIVQYVLDNSSLSHCTVQVQLHKIIWDANERGV